MASFDEEVGIGEVELDDGRRLRFHCTAISDGSRSIEAGTAVAVDVEPGHGGRYEGRRITPLSPS